MARNEEAGKADEKQSEAPNTEVEPEASTEGTSENADVEPTVDFIGLADVRTITGEDLVSSGVKTKFSGTYEWNHENGHSLPVADFDKSTLEFLRSQSDFRVN